MKRLFKRSAIALVLILTMIAAFSMAVSATTTPTGPIASVSVNGGTPIDCNTADELWSATNRVAGTVEVTLHADVTVNTAIVVSDTLIIKSADGVTPTLTIKTSKNNGNSPYNGGFVFASASKKVEFKNINIVVEESTLADDTKGGASLVMLNSLTEATVWAGNSEVVLDNVTLTSVGAVINQYTTGEFANCYVTVNGGSVTATGDFIEAFRSAKADKFAFNLTVTGDATITAAKLYSTPTDPDSNPNNKDYITYGNDAAAKAAGYTHRVGDTATGKAGEVYFATKDDALNQAPAGVKVYDISGAEPVEVVKACEHTYTDEVVAPTCDAEGYTKHTCSKCGATFNDTTVAALGHKYSKATCTSKAKCSVCNAETGDLGRHKYSVATCTAKATCEYCGAERGELAKHVDSDNNDKCDKCGAKMSADETTAPATEEKKGCGGTVGVAGLALVAALGSCALFVEKKRK